MIATSADDMLMIAASDQASPIYSNSICRRQAQLLSFLLGFPFFKMVGHDGLDASSGLAAPMAHDFGNDSFVMH